MKMLVRGAARPPPEKEVLFHLEQTVNGVAVKAQLSEEGPSWNILYFNNDGTVTKFGYISPLLGLVLDGTGSIKIY